MNTTFEEKLQAAAAKARAAGQKALKHPVSSILSLCMIAGVAATIASFSQTGEAPIPSVEVATVQNTMPVARTITDTKGRALNGNILAKSADAIMFQREGDTKKFAIKLDTLSADDRTFIAALVTKKTSILFVVNHNATPYAKYSETLSWLKSHDYDITIGIMDADTTLTVRYPTLLARQEKSWKIPLTEKVVAMSPIQIMDQYDILWLPVFFAISRESIPWYEMTNHRAAQNRKIVIHTSFDKATKARFLDQKTYINLKRPSGSPHNYARPDMDDKNWIFYEDTVEPASLEKTRDQLLTALKLWSK